MPRARRASCASQSAHFGRRLPIWSASAATTERRWATIRLDVPLEFRPRKNERQAAITATLPDFQAGRRGKTRRSRQNYGRTLRS